MPDSLSILVVEDDPTIRRAICKALQSGKQAVRIEQCPDGRKAIELMRASAFDCVFLDYQLPGADGLAVLREARAAGDTTPIIIITARGDEQLAVEMMKAGATDYLSKSRLSAAVLWQAVRYAIRVHHAELAAAEAQEQLREREARLHSLIENLPFDCWARDASGRGIMQNTISKQLWGDFTGQKPQEQTVPPEVIENWQRNNEQVMAGNVLRQELRYPIAGQMRTFYSVVAPVWEGQTIRGIVGANIDITDIKRTEEALRESQQLFQQFMNRSPAVGFMKDENGRYLYINETLTRVLNPTNRPWLGKTNFEVWPPETAAEIDRDDRAVLASGQPAETLQKIPNADGLHTWLVYRYPLMDPAGKRIVAGMALDITARQLAEQRLRDAEERYHTLFEHSPYGVIIVDPADGSFVEFNTTAHRQLGYTRDEFARFKVADVEVAENPDAAQAHFQRIMETGFDEFETRQRAKSGEVRDMLVSARRTSIGGRILLHSTQQDVTERNRLRQQLIQSQKMEAIGRLAGGIAHDFNNLLAVITGYSEAMLRRIAEDNPLHLQASEILKAAERGGALTHRLLAFSRRQIIKPQVLDLNKILEGFREMLHRVISNDIVIAMKTNPALGRVQADPGQMEQVVLNLALNARDAMANGGTLTIRTQNVDLAGRRAEMAGLPPGAYVKLTVSDTGTGMDAATLARIFEPFFTTKEGKGTGLGLSIVYGIVRQCGGNITVHSQRGQGSTFEVHLPVHSE